MSSGAIRSARCWPSGPVHRGGAHHLPRHAVTGYPDPLPALASFEDWSRIVRSALVWLGRDDPVETMEAARADDPVTAALRALFVAWYAAVGSIGLTAGEAKARATSVNRGEFVHLDLQEVVRAVAESRRGDLCSRELGKFLGRHIVGMRATPRKPWDHGGKSRIERGYDSRWMKLRPVVLQRDHHLCQPYRRRFG